MTEKASASPLKRQKRRQNIGGQQIFSQLKKKTYFCNAIEKMNKEIFNDILKRPCAISNTEWPILHRDLKNYPYCALLQVLDLLGGKACGAISNIDDETDRVALYAIGTQSLNKLLSQTTYKEPSPAPAPTKKPAQNAESEPSFDILQEINSFQEVSFKTAPKNIILSNFLKSNDYLSSEIAEDEVVEAMETDKKSIREDTTIYTETLAVILEKQGKFEKAIEVYNHLITKYPEKNSTFANQIELLKAKLEQK